MLRSYLTKTYHQNLLERLLRKNSYLITGKILDIGSKNRRHDHLFNGEITAIDIVPNEKLNVLFGNVEKGLNFSDNSFDSIICIEVLEYLENYKKAIKEIYRLVKPNGNVIITIPFMCYDHEDKLRFTKEFILSELSMFSSVRCFKIGNAFVLVWDLLFREIMKITNISNRKFFISLLFFPWFFILRSFKLEKIKDENYIGLFIMLKK